MIGIDTNVLVRHIAQDDAKQSPRATRLIKGLSSEDPGFVSLVSVVELNWVLEGAYDFTRAEILDVLETLLRSAEIVVERADIVFQALRAYRGSTADLADCLIAAFSKAAGCDRIMTFDVKASKAAGMTLLD
jgi:predicted nucleic-acid-binding protein